MKKQTKKEIRNWLIFIALGGTLYLTGWHTEVIGRIQQVLLYSNLFQPTLHDTSSSTDERIRQFNIAPYITPLNDIADQEYDQLSDSKLYFINFWATWCPPCVAEMPDITALRKDVNDRGWPIQFIMVSLDEQPQKAQQFILRKDLPLPIYQLQSRLPARFDIGTIPSTYVLDRDGRIIAERHGMARYHTDRFIAFLEEQLNINRTTTN